MQGAFISAHTYDPPSVLGRQLRPLSPWHGVLLEAAGSPYLMGGVPKLDDLVLGVWICSKSFSDGFRGAADTAAAVKWGKSLRRPQFAREMEIFTEYLNTSFMTPEYWSKGAGEGQIKAPYFWHLATFAMRELNMTEAQAWDMPITRLACYQACVAEINGNKDLMSSDEIKGMDILREDMLAIKETE